MKVTTDASGLAAAIKAASPAARKPTRPLLQGVQINGQRETEKEAPNGSGA